MSIKTASRGSNNKSHPAKVSARKAPKPLASTKVVTGRTLWKMKRAQQARDRARAARGEFSDSFLISPELAREAQVEWPDVDLDD